MFRKIVYFFKHGIWQHSQDGAESAKESWLVRGAKIAAYTVKGLTEHDVGVRAASLTFFTLMSIVPIAALIFGVVKGFGLETNLTDYLYTRFGDYREVVDYILQFANNMLARVRGGVVASVGFLVLFWAVVHVFSNVESALNNVWEVKKQRSLARKFSDYITVVIVAPILWLVSNGMMNALRARMETAVSGGWLVELLFGIVSLVAVWLIFALVYYVLPNTKVKFKGALIAGVIAGTLFQIFQVGYFAIQGYLNSYNMIYGSFAALPLFLIWLQWSWMILLVGAELSFAYQNIRNYEQERQSLHMCYDRRRKVMLAVMAAVSEHFLNGEGPVRSTRIAEEIGMPVRIVRDVLFDLEQAGMIATVHDDRDDMVSMYTPAVDVRRVTIADMLRRVECITSLPSNFSFEGNEKLEKVEGTLDRIRTAYETSPDNMSIAEFIEGRVDEGGGRR